MKELDKIKETVFEDLKISKANQDILDYYTKAFAKVQLKVSVFELIKLCYERAEYDRLEHTLTLKIGGPSVDKIAKYILKEDEEDEQFKEN